MAGQLFLAYCFLKLGYGRFEFLEPGGNFLAGQSAGGVFNNMSA
jgi:hypothetical protein